MHESAVSQERWVRCPPGELERVARRERVDKRRQALGKLAGVSAVMAFSGVGGFFVARWLLKSTEYRFGGIACSDVVPLFRDYYQERLGDELTRKVSLHLEQCPHCGPAYRHMAATMARSRQA